MDLVANLYSQLTLNDNDEETDDDTVTQIFNNTELITSYGHVMV